MNKFTKVGAPAKNRTGDLSYALSPGWTLLAGQSRHVFGHAPELDTVDLFPLATFDIIDINLCNPRPDSLEQVPSVAINCNIKTAGSWTWHITSIYIYFMIWSER